MKKLSYRIYALLIAILTCVMLTACSAGSKIYTELILNKDLSGARIMDVEIDDAVFNESFSGTIDDLNNTIINNCPEGMTYSYSEVDGIKTYRFEIAFSSPEDYQQKVRNITGQENVITINTPDTVWASGFFIDEDFTSTTLLTWLKDAIVNDGLVDASNAGNILSEGDCKVTFNGEEFSSYNEINVDTIDYLSMDSIDVLTKVSDIGQYDRTVVFTISNEVMQKKGDEIKAFFEQRVPGGANKEWTDGENGESIYTVKKTAINADGISAMNKDLFGTEVSVFDSTEILEGLSPFTFAVSNEEIIDLSQYIASGNQNVRVTSLLSMGDNLLYGTNVDRANILTNSLYQQSVKYPEYYEVTADYVRGGYNYNNTYVFVKKYPVKELNITTKKTLTGNYERDFEFIFDKVPTETEQEVIITRLQKPFPQEKASKKAESEEGAESATTEEAVANDEEKAEVKKYNIKFKNNVKKDVYTISVSEKGSALELEEMTTLLTGNKSKVVYGEKFAFHKTKFEEVYTESIRLGDLGKDVTEDFVCNYVIDLGMGSKINTVGDKAALIEGGKVTLITNNVPREVYVLSERFNIWAVLFYIFLLGGIVLLGVAVIKSGILKIFVKPAKPAEPAAIAVTESTETTEEAPVAVEETTEVVEETAEAVVETTEAVAETTEAVVETTEAATETAEAVVETTKAATETAEAVVETTETAAETTETAVEEEKGSFCPNCGEHRDDDALVCVKCGLRF